MRALLDEDDDEHQHSDLGQHRAGPAFEQLVQQALCAFPASPEAWLASVVQSALAVDIPVLGKTLTSACACIPADQRFLLLEGLLDVLPAARAGDGTPGLPLKPATISELVRACVAVLSGLEPDALICYYCAKLYLFEADLDNARHWLEKSLVLNADFWLARLELVSLVLTDLELTPFLAEGRKLQLSGWRDMHGLRLETARCGNC